MPPACQATKDILQLLLLVLSAIVCKKEDERVKGEGGRRRLSLSLFGENKEVSSAARGLFRSPILLLFLFFFFHCIPPALLALETALCLSGLGFLSRLSPFPSLHPPFPLSFPSSCSCSSFCFSHPLTQAKAPKTEFGKWQGEEGLSPGSH